MGANGMSGEAAYEYQAIARGLRTPSDVEALVDYIAPAYRHLLPRWLPSNRDAAIYETACGPGIMLSYLKRAGYTNASGSDSSACQIELARAAHLNVKLADSIAELEIFPDDYLDCLIAIDFIEHLPKDVLIRFFELAYRKLKRKSSLILRAPNGDSPFVGRNLFGGITHVWAYTAGETRALLQMAGFGMVEFGEEGLALVRRQRWIRVPLMRLANAFLRALIYAATKEKIEFLAPSLYTAAWKPGPPGGG
jgi:SAM-dependent methyltransferase